jgi:ABC-type glycerol-3-phosphate transport system substrate-binding protein
MPTGTKHPKEAAELMQYMVSAEPVLEWAIGESNMPPTKAAAFDPRLVKALPYMASTDVGTARAALTNPKLLTLFPNSSIYDYVKTQYSTAMAQVEYGHTTAKAALDVVQKQADQREITAKQQNPTWYSTGD